MRSLAGIPHHNAPLPYGSGAPQQRQCLLLRISQELSYEEIAGMLRLSVNTVRIHLAGAKKRLRQALSNA